jgi:hypothetical protein
MHQSDAFRKLSLSLSLSSASDSNEMVGGHTIFHWNADRSAIFFLSRDGTKSIHRFWAEKRFFKCQGDKKKNGE